MILTEKIRQLMKGLCLKFFTFEKKLERTRELAMQTSRERKYSGRRNRKYKGPRAQR